MIARTVLPAIWIALLTAATAAQAADEPLPPIPIPGEAKATLVARVGGFVTDLPAGYPFPGEELTYDFAIGTDRFIGYAELRDDAVRTFTIERDPDSQASTPRERCERSYFGLLRLLDYAFGPPDTPPPVFAAAPVGRVALAWTLRTGAQVILRLDERPPSPPSAGYCAIFAEFDG